MLTWNTSRSFIALLYPDADTLPMNTTSTAANAAVAEKISIFLAPVNSARATEKIVVNRITRPMRISMLLTKYSTSTIKVGRAAERAATIALLVASMLRSW